MAIMQGLDRNSCDCMLVLLIFFRDRIKRLFGEPILKKLTCTLVLELKIFCRMILGNEGVCVCVCLFYVRAEYVI
jgi:hypothetical protein